MRAAALVLVLAVPAVAQDSNTARDVADRVDAATSGDPGDGRDGDDGDAPAGESGDPGFGGGEAGGGETGGGDAATGGDGGDTPASAPESYTVQPGDTLWNLSQRFLNNPWYWPKIWSYNPELDNPNWISPGRQIRFYPNLETPVVVQPPAPEEDEGGGEDFEDVQGGGFEGDNVADRFTGLGAERRRREFFIPSERLEEAGQVLNSPEEKRLLTINDRVYVKLKKQGQPGEVFQAFRATRDVRHPVTGANLGKLVELVGEVRVDVLSRDQALGTVVNSWDPVERGDYVGALPVDTEPVRAVENTKAVKGYVVEAGALRRDFFGENFVVILDRGSNDGVQIGNTFIVVRAGDPYLRQYSGLADEDIGEILIVEVEKTVSTGLLINSSREIVPGDRAEMRVR